MKLPKFEKCKDVIYWFVERSASGGLALNVSGMFYFIGNFVRLGVVIAAAFCFIGASATVVRLGLRVGPSPDGTYDIPAVRNMLYSFSIIELWTKGLYFILNIHAKVWGKSCLSGDLNIKLAGVVVFVIGWIVLTLPRNFVEYRLWQLFREKAAANPDDGLPDLRNQEIQWVYTAASTLFFLSVATLFLVSQDGPVGLKTLWKLFAVLGLGGLLPVLGIDP